MKFTVPVRFGALGDEVTTAESRTPALVVTAVALTTVVVGVLVSVGGGAAGIATDVAAELEGRLVTSPR